MPSTFGSFIVYQDASGYHIAQNPPKHLGESPVERTHYAGPRVIMPETVADFESWLAARKKEGFTFKSGK
jgi:hypothetical protein